MKEIETSTCNEGDGGTSKSSFYTHLLLKIHFLSRKLSRGHWHLIPTFHFCTNYSVNQDSSLCNHPASFVWILFSLRSNFLQCSQFLYKLFPSRSITCLSSISNPGFLNFQLNFTVHFFLGMASHHRNSELVRGKKTKKREHKVMP